jgi:hypothetical protein
MNFNFKQEYLSIYNAEGVINNIAFMSLTYYKLQIILKDSINIGFDLIS